MMLRSLVDEVVRRRLWPIPVLAVLVAIAAPLLFMKSAPQDASAVTEAPAAAAPAALPAKARKLLATSDKAVVSHKRSTRKAQDPFQPPASASKPASASSAAKGASGGSGSGGSVPVVIKNSDGSTSTATISPSTTGATGSATKAGSQTKPKSTTPKVTVPKVTAPKITDPKTTSSSAVATKKVTYVDARFGKQMGTMIRYRVPRLQTFRAGGKVAAMFVGYSANRNAAVFAVAPSTAVSGVTCRQVAGVCRYVDLPAGAHARLTMRGANGAMLSRRLDVVSIRHLPKMAASKANARMTSLSTAKCLLQTLLALPATVPSISTNACA